MSDFPMSVPALASHVEGTVRSTTQLGADHLENATGTQLWVDRVTALIARPLFLGVVTLAVAGWIGFNTLISSLGYAPPDPAPFGWLIGVISLGAFYSAVLILISQRREDVLAQHHAQLTLQLTLLNEQKIAKIIALIEEFRRDSPQLPDRVDNQAAAMAEVLEPQQLIGALKDAKATVVSEASL